MNIVFSDEFPLEERLELFYPFSCFRDQRGVQNALLLCPGSSSQTSCDPQVSVIDSNTVVSSAGADMQCLISKPEP